ncbi:hypothetical protein [Limosilactobacillus fermentum]
MNPTAYRRIKDHGGVILARPLTPTVANAKAAEACAPTCPWRPATTKGGSCPSTSREPHGSADDGRCRFDPGPSRREIKQHARGVKAALVLGAQGVYVGTRFFHH